MSTKIDNGRTNLEVKLSKISGRGVFTKIEIRKGQTICFLNGEKINLNEMVRRVNLGAEMGSDPLQTGDEEYLDLDDFSRSFNHSCNPNSFIKGKNELVALKNIGAGEEITYDYSSTMDDNYKNASRGIWTNKCNCGSPNCRGTVDQFRMLPKDVKEFYLKNSYAQDFILKKFCDAKA